MSKKKTTNAEISAPATAAKAEKGKKTAPKAAAAAKPVVTGPTVTGPTVTGPTVTGAPAQPSVHAVASAAKEATEKPGRKAGAKKQSKSVERPATPSMVVTETPTPAPTVKSKARAATGNGTSAAKPVATLSIPSEEIARLAYSYAEARGFQGGSPESDWLRAEQELRRLRGI